MTIFNKKAFKGLPTAIRVRKPRYYYQDIIETYTENTTKDLTLTEFEGLDYELNYSTLTFADKKLWNNEDYNGSTRALAPLYKDRFVEYGGYSVVGSLTNEDNVFSGFSGSNYLSLNGDFEVGSNTWEVVAKFTTTDSFPNLQGIYHFHNALSSNGRYGLIIRMQGSKFNLTVASGYSWMINTTGTYTIQPNTTYWVKASFDGSKYVLSYSLDGIEYIDDIVYNSTSALLSGLGIMVAGAWYSGSSYIEPLLGTLDLNECYMKIGDNFAWTPEVTEEIQQYTPEYLTSVRKLVYGVNGSPTIVDNVASGFSSSNYVTIDAPKFSEADNWEIFTKITTGNDVTSSQILYQISKTTADSGRFGVVLFISTDNNTLSFKPNLSFTGSAWAATSDFTSEVNNNYTFEANTTYYTKLSFDGNCYKVEVSKNNIDWDVAYEAYTTTKIYSGLTYTRIGSYNNSSTNYFKGSIDLNESYIKINGVEIWGKNAKNIINVKGCLDEGLSENYNETTYNAFVKDSDVLLTDKENVEGMFWANRVFVPEHLKSAIYEPNYNVVGTLTYDTVYNVSGFSANNYVVTPKLFGENPYTFITKININSQSDGNMILVTNDGGFVPELYLQKASKTLTVYNGTSYTGNTVVPVNTWYWVKLEWDGETLKWYTAPYVENSYFEPAWTLENSITENLFNVKKSYRIGSPDSTTSYYLHGLVDLKATKYYENNELVWQALKEV